MTPPRCHTSLSDIRDAVAAARGQGRRIALVPTMGALHEGHLSLVRKAQDNADHVIVSIFVNPTQFAPTEDFASYPRDAEADIRALASLGVESVFLPVQEEMYPSGFATGVTIGGPATGLESDSRPHFFNGVALVVTKLLLACQPDIAVFGEKDYQQLCVIRQLVRDLNIPVTILAAPTVREADGLAMSSRNRYLDEDARRRAALLPEVLRDTLRALSDCTGADRQEEALLRKSIARLTDGGFRVEYLSLRDAETLAPPTDDSRHLRLLVAAWLEKTRLIDNMAFERRA
ncbi:pantoate--beta-alanine ligase [Stappia indica]|uniref:pantoate--beta-alanine ligase n=1 Tax=Stappia indica TaxID=538381 RepID=UPI001CD69045|nr:pantoate--beta-alanine ligase [Stappia indica]MCA1300370.1 pantoate--beta-alanine ligase [Stappia indica]